MPTIGIRIVYAGNNSRVGHMYVVFKDDAGQTTAFGHYPTSAVNAIGGLGGVRENFDLDEHELRTGAPGTNGVPNIGRDFAVSNSAFQVALNYSRVAASQAGDKTKPWGIYTPLYNSCVDFAWNVMREAGLAEGNWFEGFFLPGWNRTALDDAYFDYFRRPEFRREDKHSITSVINTTYRIAAATRPPAPRDPLALDLDGDGIETIGLTAAPVLFDHNADGIRTGTGWVTGDDGWLVLDRNGDVTNHTLSALTDSLVNLNLQL